MVCIILCVLNIFCTTPSAVGLELMKMGFSHFLLHAEAPCTPKPVTKVSKPWDRCGMRYRGLQLEGGIGGNQGLPVLSGSTFYTWKLFQPMITITFLYISRQSPRLCFRTFCFFLSGTCISSTISFQDDGGGLLLLLLFVLYDFLLIHLCNE